MDSEFLLVWKMKQGEEAAFEEFVRKYYGEILNYCAYRCADKAYAEDLTQETFVRFFGKLPKYHERGKARNYLYTIAGNLCRDYWRKRKEISLEGTGLEERLESEDHQMESLLDQAVMEWALQQLPEELCEVIVLHYFQGLKLREVAEVLKVGLPLVKYRIRQAKMQLEKLLRKEEGYGSAGTTYGV